MRFQYMMQERTRHRHVLILCISCGRAGSQRKNSCTSKRLMSNRQEWISTLQMGKMSGTSKIRCVESVVGGLGAERLLTVPMRHLSSEESSPRLPPNDSRHSQASRSRCRRLGQLSCELSLLRLPPCSRGYSLPPRHTHSHAHKCSKESMQAYQMRRRPRLLVTPFRLPSSKLSRRPRRNMRTTQTQGVTQSGGNFSCITNLLVYVE